MRGEINKLKILIALIIIFQGFSIALVSHPLIKASPWLRALGWLMIIGGCGYIYFLYHVRKLEPEKETKEDEDKQQLKKTRIGQKKQIYSKLTKESIKQEVREPVEQSILTKIMTKIVNKTEKFSQYTLPVIGAIIVDAVIIYNILISQNIDIKSWDMITIMFGVSLIAYNYIPDKYNFARDFFVFFLGLLFLILVFPPIFYELFLGEGGSAEVTRVLLAEPVSGILNLGGIDSYIEININPETSAEVAYIYFPLKANGLIAGVGITEACSGIYTASIFLAAFITFVLVEYKRFDVKVGIIIGLGILTTYIANILRMTIIILVGHFYDTDPSATTGLTNLNWWHINAGWLIFMGWIIPFWWLMYRYLMKKDIGNVEETETYD